FAWRGFASRRRVSYFAWIARSKRRHHFECELLPADRFEVGDGIPTLGPRRQRDVFTVFDRLRLTLRIHDREAATAWRAEHDHAERFGRPREGVPGKDRFVDELANDVAPEQQPVHRPDRAGLRF